MSPKPVPSLLLLCACLVFAIPATTYCAAESAKPATAAYEKKLYDTIASIWYLAVKANEKRVAVGTVKIKFRINSDGQIKNLKILSNTSNQLLVEASVRAIKEAKPPPLPKTLLKEQEHNWLDVDLSFKMFPN